MDLEAQFPEQARRIFGAPPAFGVRQGGTLHASSGGLELHLPAGVGEPVELGTDDGFRATLSESESLGGARTRGGAASVARTAGEAYWLAVAGGDRKSVV